jgi:hypothetical protein
MMKISRLTLALAALLATSPAWSGQYRVQNSTQAWYYTNDSVSGSMYGSNADGSPKIFTTSEYLGSVWDSNSGNTSGSVPAALSYSGTWTGDASRGLNDVAYNLSAQTQWGANHAQISFDNYRQVDSTSTTYYVPSTALGVPIPGLPVIQSNTQTSSNVYGYAQSQWEELYMIGGSSISALGHYNATFHVDGKLGNSTNSDGTGYSSMSWSLRDFNNNSLVSINAGYNAANDSWYKQTYSAGISTYDIGTGQLVINEDLQENGGIFSFGTALYLNSQLQVNVSGNGVSSFENTVKMTKLELPGGSRVYAMSGANLSNYSVAFDGSNGGGGVLCDGLNCATTGIGGGTVVPGVPEPENYALMLAGLGLMATIIRRRKQKQA